MRKCEKFRTRLNSRQADNNFDFNDMRNFLLHLGFRESIEGDHHIFRCEGITDRINLQPEGGKCKAYQVRQIRKFLADNEMQEVMMFEKYTIILFWSEQDNRYLAQIPNLPGAFSDGKTYEEALLAIRRIGEEWIDVAREDGILIPCPKPHRVPELELV